MRKNTRWDVASVATIPLIITLGNSMMIPVLPIMQRKLHITAFQSSLVITAYSLIAIVLIPVAGFVSDRIGRKRVILPSFAITAVGGLVAGMGASPFHSYALVLAGRFLQGAGSAGAMPIAMPLVGDILKRDEEISKALGTIETANTFGKVLSPILGAVLAAWAFYLPFYAIPLLCVASAAMIMIFVRVPKRDKSNSHRPTSLPMLLALLRHHLRWLAAVFLVGATAMFVLFGTLVYFSDRLESDWNANGISKGALLAIPLCCLCLASYGAGRIIGKNKRRMKYMVAGSCLLAGIGSAVAALVFVTEWLMIAVCIIGIGIGGALPAVDALITESMQKEQRGSITSVYTSTRFIGVAAGPPVVSLLSSRGQPSVFWLMALACGLPALYSLWAIQAGTRGGKREI
ncbi:multidrug resistance protein [Alicyclobacillus hesperidum]|uniref:Multidrug resistance protein n=1 Tax=Alicyclobacillus hesperidum TaxID=89784 RepID=A0A1H2WWG2_9BACL|nr:MFS transporter [Alicyclobacillus hesperidum]GLV13036.1 multidrug resistance protein [Alicyclobacillus hesperidum]SDW84970.1 MFS transporter, ACDE family, multidrug resistance protein [Alicyclobacillus hesperidum]